MHALLETLQQAIIDERASLPRRFLKPKKMLAPNRQINIYAQAYKGRLQEILEADYPMLMKQMGGRIFRAACKRYISEQPPRQVDLAAYSRSFADFLRRKHNHYSADVIKTAFLEAAELQLLELESFPAFHPAPDASLEQLLALHLQPQPASLYLEGQFLYRVGGTIYNQPVAAEIFNSLQLLKKGTLAQWLENQPLSHAALAPSWLMQWLSASMLCLKK